MAAEQRPDVQANALVLSFAFGTVLGFVALWALNWTVHGEARTMEVVVGALFAGSLSTLDTASARDASLHISRLVLIAVVGAGALAWGAVAGRFAIVAAIVLGFGGERLWIEWRLRRNQKRLR